MLHACLQIFEAYGNFLTFNVLCKFPPHEREGHAAAKVIFLHSQDVLCMTNLCTSHPPLLHAQCVLKWQSGETEAFLASLMVSLLLSENEANMAITPPPLCDFLCVCVTLGHFHHIALFLQQWTQE